MSSPGNTHLEDDEALDVARLTGLPWYWARLEMRGPVHPFIDLIELDWWDRFRVAWARIGAYALLAWEKKPESSFSSSSSSSCSACSASVPTEASVDVEHREAR